MFELKKIIRNSTTGRIDYEYQYPSSISKFFSKNKFYVQYNLEVEFIPDEILSIPLLANVLPISWFAGFDIKVDVLDQVFYEQAAKLKKQFAEYYPIINSKNSNLIVSHIIKNSNTTSEKTAMLFSGGVDAYTTFLRHYEEAPDLITIRGADIAIGDVESWQMVIDYNESTDAIKDNTKHYIESNLREFYTFEVEQLLNELGWWGKIQHGIALISLAAPIAYENKYTALYIASTRSSKMPFSPWGSMPETDNLVKFFNTTVSHDGYELTRLDKVRTILELSNKHNVHPPLRVCYHDLKEELNCNRCEKCCRTIFAIMINNKNPNLFGFKASAEVYKTIIDHLNNGFSTAGIKFYWDELISNIDTDNFYFYKNKDEEQSQLIVLTQANKNAQIVGVINKSDNKFYIFKQKIINKYPKAFKLYLKMRKKKILF